MQDSDLIRSSLMCVLGWGFFVEVSEDLRQATTFWKGIAAKQMRAWTSMDLSMVLAVPYINILFWVKSSEILSWHPLLPLQTWWLLWQTSGVFSISGRTPNSAFQIGASCDELEVSYCRGYCLGTSEFVTIHQMMGVRIDIFAALCFRMPNDMCCMVLYPFHEVDGVISYMIMWPCSYQL